MDIGGDSEKRGSKKQSRVHVTLDNMRLVYEVLKRHCPAGRCRMSVRDIAEECGMAHSTAHRALQRLKAEGFIEIEPARYVNEPDTIVINPHGFSDSLLNARSILERVIEDLNEVYALLPMAAKTAPEVEQKAAFFDQLLSSAVGFLQLPDNYVQVVFCLAP